MGYRHSTEEILAAAVEETMASGWSGLTFKRVGDRLGISDRTVVYYFPTKLDLIGGVAGTLAGKLTELLESAFGSGPMNSRDLLKRAWPTLTASEADQIFVLFFEIVGLAASRTSPFDVLAPTLVDGWVEWLVPHVLGSSLEIRRRRALAAVAQIDGLLLIRHILGSDAANAAAHEIGIA